MQPSDFIRKWEKSTLKESAAAQQHFLDLCELIDVAKPADMDHSGDNYCFEKGATKSTGGQGFADVWKKGCFGWEYKGPKANLDAAYAQLQRYAVALENPPLLIVSDTKRIIIRTNWTNTVSEKHEITLADLEDQKNRDLLRNCFENPDALKPKRTRDELTREAADEFSKLAQRLRDKGHDAQTVAHFVNRLVFCMFAEDVNLLPNKLFQKAMERSHLDPDRAEGHLTNLFAAMQNGGEFGLEDIPWFNGGLFDSPDALPLDRDDVDIALNAAKLYWGDIDPSILGTLFERGLDPSKRSQLGAHYTDRDKIMMIIRPVIVEPLESEWRKVKAKIEEQYKRKNEAQERIAQVRGEASQVLQTTGSKSGESVRQQEITKLRSQITRAENRAKSLLESFTDKLADFRVLDPACGSGNFLYVSLKALKDIEHRANVEFETYFSGRRTPKVGPEAVKGIELNPYAAELARVSIWIGEIQWMRENGFYVSDKPILKPLDNIECRDAILMEDGRRADWPDSTVVVGNPPFLGNKRMIDNLGEEYTVTLRTAWPQASGNIDLVAYWFVKAWEMILAGRLARAGLVATNSVRGGANREVLKPIVDNGRIFDAWSDEPWVVDGAAVRVSLICFELNADGPSRLDGKPIPQIFSDLSPGGLVDITGASRLGSNRGCAFQGPVKVGSFDVSGETARDFLKAPLNPNGRPNADVLFPWANGMDITRRPSGKWIIDFQEMSEQQAALYETPFQWIIEHVKPSRDANRRARRRERYWQHGETVPGLRQAIEGIQRIIITPRVAKHRLFVWSHNSVLPDSAVVAIARDDGTSLGILHSHIHEIWALRMGSFLGKGNDPRYTPTTCFETFPFPEGLSPDISAKDYASDPRAQKIAEAAALLDELRQNWLNPPDLVKRVPEVVEGYPDRILPVSKDAEKILKKRTLTNLYNERPAWLDHAHRALDEAVAEAYGWGEDFRSGTFTDEEILKRLFALNQARSKQN